MKTHKTLYISSAHGTLMETDHVLGHTHTHTQTLKKKKKTSKKVESVYKTSDYNTIELERNHASENKVLSPLKK